jgi:cellulose synthase/poly-beta-1,6-N-acetylglucosamine synthase-like glycosyltransferase
VSALQFAVRIQTVLFGQRPSEVARLIRALGASVRHLRHREPAAQVSIVLGDCSPTPLLNEAEIGGLAEAAGSAVEGVDYVFFDANLGSAGGANRLATDAQADFLVVLNPDTYPCPTFLAALLAPFHDPDVGCADARQLPLEHLKDYDVETGEQSWASGACLMVRSDAFHKVGGFDPEHFFLYCDDVDFSWRLRLAGFRIVHAPDAAVFHDKRMDAHGVIVPTAAEDHQALLGRLTLARRYGRADVVAQILDSVRDTDRSGRREAVAQWERWEAEGRLPEALAGAGSVATFTHGEPGTYRKR